MTRVDFTKDDPREDEDAFGFTCPEGMSYCSVREYVWLGVMGFCGCYDDALFKEFFHVMGKLWEARSNDESWHYECTSDKLQELILHCLNEKKLVEHGGSVRGSWLTEKGIRLCKMLEKDLSQ